MNGGVMSALLTDFETAAIRDARVQFAEALEKAGVMAAFMDLPGEVIDGIILAALEGFRESMRRQAFDDRVPF